jgi:hypothetical protein
MKLQLQTSQGKRPKIKTKTKPLLSFLLLGSCSSSMAQDPKLIPQPLSPELKPNSTADKTKLRPEKPQESGKRLEKKVKRH